MNKHCGICPSCEMRARWEARYVAFLKEYPSKDSEEFIAEMRKTDMATLKCLKLNPVDPAETRSYKNKLTNYFPTINI